jgi:hypothetical protein
MLRIVFILVFSAIMAGGFSTVSGQESYPSRYSINIGIGAEKTGIPFRAIIDFPLHSSYHAGLERRWHRDKQRRTFQGIDLIFFNNTSSGSGFSFQTSYGMRLFIFKNVFFSPSGGMGIVHLFRPRESYILENGVYVPYRDKGRLRPVAQVNLKIGYLHGRAGIVGAYQAGVHYDYNGDFQFMPRNFLSIGLIYIFGELADES